MKSSRIIWNFVFLAVFSGFWGCSDPNQQSNVTPNAENKNTSDPLPHNLNESRQNTDNEFITYTNPIEYAQSVDSLRTWGLLCEYSKWGNDVRGGNYTLLVPKINLLKAKGKELLVALRDKKNADILNEFIAAHILKTDISVSKWKYDDRIETIDGRQYKVGGQVIQDMVYFTYEIPTKHGNVVITEGMLNFPEKELRARMDAK